MSTQTESPTAEIIRGNWSILKGRLKQKYAGLTDNDLMYVEGQEEELLGRVQKRTGKDLKAIEKFIKDSCNCR